MLEGRFKYKDIKSISLTNSNSILFINSYDLIMLLFHLALHYYYLKRHRGAHYTGFLPGFTDKSSTKLSFDPKFTDLNKTCSMGFWY